VQWAQKLLSTRGGTIALSVTAAVLAGVILLTYLHRYRESVNASGADVTVLVAKNSISKGTSGDIIAAQDDQALARPQHQRLHHGKAFDAGGFGDARHAEAPRQQAGAADHGQHQQQGAEVTKNVDEFHFFAFFAFRRCVTGIALQHQRLFVETLRAINRHQP